LERSVRWFSKWWAEYQLDPHTDFSDGSHAPHHSPSRLPTHVEQAIVNVRRRLEAAEFGLIGPPSVRQALEHLQLAPLPSVSAIARLLAKHGLSRPRGAASDDVYYPEWVAWAPNVIHATDIITRHLYGGEVVQNFHTIDHYSHAVHLSPSADKSSRSACTHLRENWGILGLPGLQQLDNEDAFSGGHTHPRVLGQVVRLCLFVGSDVLFNPEYEAKRNYWIEGFHSLWLQAFWSRRVFRNCARVVSRTPAFEHWYHHCYQPPSLQGHTPLQMREGFQPVRLTRLMQRLIPERLPITAGQINFMRKVDAAGNIRLLNESWRVGSRWINTYVCATIDTLQQALHIWHKPDANTPWQILKTRPFKLAEPVQPLLPIFHRKCARSLDYWPS
jgi:hypothetical protein